MKFLHNWLLFSVLIFASIAIHMKFLHKCKTPVSSVPYTLETEVTAYCGCEICCGSYSDGITASGYKIRSGDRLIAAPRPFQFGTKMFIPGYGMASVEDRGGAITKNRLDVYFDSHEKALEWGRQVLQVTIYGEN